MGPKTKERSNMINSSLPQAMPTAKSSQALTTISPTLISPIVTLLLTMQTMVCDAGEVYVVAVEEKAVGMPAVGERSLKAGEGSCFWSHRRQGLCAQGAMLAVWFVGNRCSQRWL